MSDDFETRGVKNPKVVDLILPQGGEVVLRMVEDRPWGTDEGQIDQLGEKFNNYLDYVLDGWFYKQYPAHEGKRVCIELEYVSTPGPDVAPLIAEMGRYSASVGVRFEAKQKNFSEERFEQ